MNKRLDLIFKIGNIYKLDLICLLEAIIFKDIDILLKNKNIKKYHLNLIKSDINAYYFYIFLFTKDKYMINNKYKSYLKYLIKNKLYYIKFIIDLIDSIKYAFEHDIEYYNIWHNDEPNFYYIYENLNFDFNKYTIKIIKWTIKKIGLNNDIKTILNFIYLYTNINIKLKEWGQLRSVNLKTYRFSKYDFEKRFRKKRFTMWDSKYISNYIN